MPKDVPSTTIPISRGAPTYWDLNGRRQLVSTVGPIDQIRTLRDYLLAHIPVIPAYLSVIDQDRPAAEQRL
jgi:hypothetical protein